MIKILFSFCYLSCHLLGQTHKHQEGKEFMKEVQERVSQQGLFDPSVSKNLFTGTSLQKDMAEAESLKDTSSDPSSLQQRFSHKGQGVSEALSAAKDQLRGSRMHLDTKMDPLFINANHAIQDPEASLLTQEITSLNEEEYEIKTCSETRSETFHLTRFSKLSPYYKRFHIMQFYNSCPNHPGWGKKIVQGCQALTNHSLFSLQRRREADYDEVHGMEWEHQAATELDALLALHKCTLEEERFTQEDRGPKRIPVYHFRKEETLASHDWNIREDTQHLEETSVLRGPEAFGSESFSKIQVFRCAVTPQNTQNTCQVLRERGGIEKTSFCNEWTAGICSSWQKTYKVPKEGVRVQKVCRTQEETTPLFHQEGPQETIEHALNEESGEVLSQFMAIKESVKAISKPGQEAGMTAENLPVFNGEKLQCVSQGGRWSRHGCPHEKGKKTPEEQKLAHLFHEGKCICVGSFEDKDGNNFGTVIGQKRMITSFCCYDSVLSRVVHEASNGQGITSMGSPQSPSCGNLNITTLQKLNWQKVDMTPFIQDISSKMSLNTERLLQKNTKAIQDHFKNQLNLPKGEHP